MSKIIGIDLGTTNSCVSILEGGVSKVILNAEGGRTTPSVVAFKNGELLVGESAKRQAVTNKDTVFSIKSKMGSTDKIDLDGSPYSPQAISSIILRALKKQAEEYLGQTVTRAVITVPAYFTDAQRQATKDAGKLAGLKVERIINEPTAAALAYGLDKLTEKQTVLVYDFGGGTFDVSVVSINEGMFEVKATAGDNSLGGDDFDKRIVDHLVLQFKEETNIDLSQDLIALGRLRETSEEAKRNLSASTSTTISLPFITSKDGMPLHLDTTLTRATFNSLTDDLVLRAEKCITQVMRETYLLNRDIDKVLLVGGTTRIPAVMDSVKKVLGQEPYQGINPDEAVAMGAAVQAGIINGELNEMFLLDVTSLSLGIQTGGGIFTKIIPRNTTIPTSQSQVFSTATKNQEVVNIQVFQGERVLAADNQKLGNVELTGIKPAPAGVPKIEVTFTIDSSGIVSVTAKDLLTGKNHTVIMSSISSLSEEQVQDMLKEAEEKSSEDIDKKYKADLIINSKNIIIRTKELLTKTNVDLESPTLAEVKSLYMSMESNMDLGVYDNLEQDYNRLKEILSTLLT